MTQSVKLAAKIAKVMEAVGYVAKTGTNSAQGYKFVQASAVADKVREQLVKFNVSMTPTAIDVISEGLTPSGKQALLTLRSQIHYRPTLGWMGPSSTCTTPIRSMSTVTTTA